ncbi:MAG: hypothetical protein ACFFCZ_08160 [Promethearchaeota archaeon]
MSHTFTTRLWNHPNSDTLAINPSIELDFGSIIKRFAPQFEIAEVHPEREEILVKVDNKSDSSSMVIRTILQELQRQTHRSFVALMSPTAPYILITVRG